MTSTAELDALRQSVDATRQEVRALREAQATDRSGDNDLATALLMLEDVETRLDRIEAQLIDLLDGLSRTQAEARPVAEPGVMNPPSAASAGDARSAYEAAYLEVTRSNYDGAIAAFSDFLRQYPATDLSDNAVYWIGECHYVKREFNRAVEAFVRLMDTYPDGDKVPAALLKLGYAFQELGDPNAARRYLEELRTRYPGSDEAAKAGERLQQL
jgi:tol-pal system protein YbgF